MPHVVVGPRLAQVAQGGAVEQALEPGVVHPAAHVAGLEARDLQEGGHARRDVAPGEGGHQVGGVLLAEQGGRWFYKRNEGEGTLGAVQRLPSQPGLSLRSGAQLQDLEGDGVRDLVMLRKPLAGYQPREGSGWGRFRPFEQVPDVDPSDPNVRVLDLDGDGHADLLVTEHDVLRWYPNQTTKGYGAPKTVRVPHSDDDGPRVVFASDSESLFLADMSGDGLTDLVRVRNRSICYWPNLGYGRFGAKVTMGSAPSFGHPGRFDPARVRLTGEHYRDVTEYFCSEVGDAVFATAGLQLFPHRSTVETGEGTRRLFESWGIDIGWRWPPAPTRRCDVWTTPRVFAPWWQDTDSTRAPTASPSWTSSPTASRVCRGC